MDIIHSEVVPVRPGTTPDYNHNNPVTQLLQLIETASLAAERDVYVFDQLQYLFPVGALQLYGPSAPNSAVLDPELQDTKTDFQKQNVASVMMADTQVVRGYANVANWTGPFIRFSYRGGPDSVLSNRRGQLLGDRIRLWTRIGNTAAPSHIMVPYNDETDRYAVEIWSWPGSTNDLRNQLDDKGRQAMARGELLVNPALVQGGGNEFTREALEGKFTNSVAPQHAMHPTLPLHIEVAWGDIDGVAWDSLGGANHQYEFNMVLRGWDSYLGVGTSANPHGGTGILEYRNLLSNYFGYSGTHELGRDIAPWMFDAHGVKGPGVRREEFMVVEYMDLHILKANCGIGLHRHRDNQEIFLMMEGRGLMVVGDWCKLPNRERCLEVRTLKAGHLAMLKGGNLHGLINPSDTEMMLFMFGGYD